MTTPMVALVVGTMNFGARTAPDEARAIVDSALATGLTHFDTANLYGDGAVETLLGQLLKGRPAHLTTKVGAWKKEGLSRQRVVAALDESLQRLQRDSVDVYLLHQPDPDTRLEETLMGLSQVLQTGKAKAWGFSNYPAWQAAQLISVARGVVPPPVQAQVLYNLVARQAEVEYPAFAKQAGFALAAYNPLAGGLLSGHSGPRLTANRFYRQRYGSSVLAQRALRIAAIGAEASLTPATLAYAWLSQRVDLIVCGPAIASHLDAAHEGLRTELSRATSQALEDLHLETVGTSASYAR
jgi:aryl-alcohol dehydrogenase-like predicted oxidoreductase